MTLMKPAGQVLAEDSNVLFFNEVCKTFAQAVELKGFCKRTIAIGPVYVDICFAGEGDLFHRIWPSLAHLEQSLSVPAKLSICCWETQSSVSPPPPPWGNEELLPKGRILRFLNGPIRANIQAWTGIFSLMNFDTGQAFYWVRDAKHLPLFEEAAPFRHILHSFLKKNSVQFLHAAAIGTDRGAILLAGQGGAGKSTTSLQALESGFLFLGDDYVATNTVPPFSVFSLYSTGKIARSQAWRVPVLKSLSPAAPVTEEGKSIFSVSSTFPHRLRRGLPLLAILLPDICKSDSSKILPVRQSEALRALAPSTIFQLADTDESDMTNISRLVRNLPVYRLELSEEGKQNLAAISLLLEDL